VSIQSNDRVLVSKLNNREYWSVISNPKNDILTQSMSTILLYSTNDYVEFRNCGALYRMVRYCDIEKYGISKSDIKTEYTLEQCSNAIAIKVPEKGKEDKCKETR